MTDDRPPLAELMAKIGDGDFLRTIAESVLQIIMEADVDGLVGAGRQEQNDEYQLQHRYMQIVRHSRATPALKRQPRLRAIESLDLAFSSTDSTIA